MALEVVIQLRRKLDFVSQRQVDSGLEQDHSNERRGKDKGHVQFHVPIHFVVVSYKKDPL